MKIRSIRIVLSALLLTGTLGFFLLLPNQTAGAVMMKATEDLRGRTVILPHSAPERDKLVPVSYIRITAEGRLVAVMAVYDDPVTDMRADYFELYDSGGGLMSVNWVDRFGIRRTAMDRGILQEEASGLEGVLILIIEGIPA